MQYIGTKQLLLFPHCDLPVQFYPESELQPGRQLSSYTLVDLSDGEDYKHTELTLVKSYLRREQVPDYLYQRELTTSSLLLLTLIPERLAISPREKEKARHGERLMRGMTSSLGRIGSAIERYLEEAKRPPAGIVAIVGAVRYDKQLARRELEYRLYVKQKDSP